MMSCIIKDLLEKPFSLRTFAEKCEIVKSGRPKPDLPNLIQNTKNFIRHFQSSAYDKCDWLAGSSDLNAVFCWNCLLFSKDRNSSWTKTGFTHLGNLVKSIAGHETTVGHLRATLSIAGFGKSRTEIALDDELKSEISAHNRKVQRNRDILKRLIYAICFLGKQGLASGSHDESENSINKNNYIELLKYTAEYDVLLAEHLETSTVFEGFSHDIQNDLIQAISSAVLSEIKRELSSTPCVAVMVDEITDVWNKAQFSIVLRYVHDGEIQERFLGFSDVNSHCNAQAIAELIHQYLSDFNCGEKLVAQAYDGVATLADRLDEMQNLIKNTHPEALLVHSYSHVLNFVLSQSVSQIRECKVFFSTLNGLAAFFTRSPKRARFLDEFLQCRLPNVCPTRWNYSSRLVNTVSCHRNQLCDAFLAMLETPERIDKDILSPVNGFLLTLEDFEFCFLLNIFNKIFSCTDVLFSFLQNRGSDILYCLDKIRETRRVIASLRDDYERVYEETVSEAGEPSKRRNTNYRRVYCEIFNNIDTHLDMRFQDFHKLQFLQLLSSDNFETYSKEFPEDSFCSLLEHYGRFFDSVRLKNELIVLYSSEEFQNKSPSELLKLCNDSLASSFPQLILLVSLACTIPVRPAAVERYSSAEERIKTYVDNCGEEERLPHLAIIFIESRLLENIRNNSEFYDDVIRLFASQERKMEFTFR